MGRAVRRREERGGRVGVRVDVGRGGGGNLVVFGRGRKEGFPCFRGREMLMLESEC